MTLSTKTTSTRLSARSPNQRSSKASSSTRSCRSYDTNLLHGIFKHERGRFIFWVWKGSFSFNEQEGESHDRRSGPATVSRLSFPRHCWRRMNALYHRYPAKRSTMKAEPGVLFRAVLHVLSCEQQSRAIPIIWRLNNEDAYVFQDLQREWEGSSNQALDLCWETTSTIKMTELQTSGRSYTEQESHWYYRC